MNGKSNRRSIIKIDIKYMLRLALLGQLILRKNVLIDEKIIRTLSECDIVIANMENAVRDPLRGSKTRITKFNDHTISSNIMNICKDLNISVLCLANNHINDYGYAGVINTITACNNLNIKPIGLDLQESSNINYFEWIKGIPIKILAYFIIDPEGEIEYDNHIYALKIRYDNEDDFNKLLSEIETDKFVIVHIHNHTKKNLDHYIARIMSKGAKCYFSTGFPKMMDTHFNNDTILCKNMGSLIFDVREQQKYNNIAFGSKILILDIENNKIKQYTEHLTCMRDGIIKIIT